MMVKRIVVNGVDWSSSFEKSYAEQWNGSCWMSGGGCCFSGVMRWCVSTRITFWGLIGENHAQTSGLLGGAECFVPGMHLNQ
jgi:hypothetical protein